MNEAIDRLRSEIDELFPDVLTLRENLTLEGIDVDPEPFSRTMKLP